MTPSLFKIATKELSQDAFFTWLLQWADQKNATSNASLHKMAVEFTKFLIGQQQEITDLTISIVEAERQRKNIDIWAEVNSAYLIIIEDKTNSGEHTDQLSRYMEIAKEEYKQSSFKHVFIYLKTGNEDIRTLKEIKKKGYAVVDRKAILNIFSSFKVDSEIFNEFNNYLIHIEDQTNAFIDFNRLKNNRRAAEGFYLRLQEILPEWTGWKYVSNPTGGFLGFFYHYNGTEDYTLYIQIENNLRGDIKVVVKIDEWDQKTGTLYKILGGLQPYSKKYGLDLTKPDRYKAGGTSTVAILKNAFKVAESGQLDIENFMVNIGNLEKVMNEYIEQDKTRNFKSNE